MKWPTLIRLAAILASSACFEPLVRVAPEGTGGGAGGGGGLTCGSQLTVCSNVCVDTRYDDLNCGSCARACPGDQSCAAGECYDDNCGEADCSPDQVCYMQRCTGKECVGVLCPPLKGCFMGACFGPECSSSTCPTPQICYQDQCIDPRCVGVLCPLGLSCVDGQCVSGCTAGATCTPAEVCQFGQNACDPMRCAPIGPTPPGTACGSDLVCSSDGGCNSCSAGAACSPSDCLTGVIGCSTGDAVCESLVARPQGTGCPGGVCYGDGGCGVCVSGGACTPSDPCRVGTLGCVDGGAVCNAGAARDAGSACGTNQVCGADAGCIACAAGSACPLSNVCLLGAFSCGSGAPVCTVAGPAAPGGVCDGGYCDGDGGCGVCTPGVACPTGNLCERGVISCATGAPQCQAMGPKSTGTVCRAAGANSTCDPAETCDGTLLSCPSDVRAAVFSGCGSNDTTDCNAADSCDGDGGCIDRLKPSSTVCRAAGGNVTCDPAENCTGASPTCPGNFKSALFTLCGSGDTTDCNAADSCDGDGGCIDRLKPSSTVCRAAGVSATCDPAENCTGSGPTCPAQNHPGPTTACGSSSTANCDAADSCDSAGNCAGRFKSNGTVCHTSQGTCDPAETCNGTDNVCPTNLWYGTGVSCPGGVCPGNGPSCVPCVNNDPCGFNVNSACKYGVIGCGGGYPACFDSTDKPNGTPCGTGYNCQGGNCVDINECNSSPCSPNASCTNTTGGYTCTCYGNFVGNGFTCTCPSGLGSCDGNPSNGCEQTLNTPTHCGACNYNSGELCGSGSGDGADNDCDGFTDEGCVVRVTATHGGLPVTIYDDLRHGPTTACVAFGYPAGSNGNFSCVDCSPSDEMTAGLHNGGWLTAPCDTLPLNDGFPGWGGQCGGSPRKIAWVDCLR